MKAQTWKMVRAEAMANGRINEKRVAELKATIRVQRQLAQAAAGLTDVFSLDESSDGESQKRQAAAADSSDENLTA